MKVLSQLVEHQFLSRLQVGDSQQIGSAMQDCAAD